MYIFAGLYQCNNLLGFKCNSVFQILKLPDIGKLCSVTAVLTLWNYADFQKMHS